MSPVESWGKGADLRNTQSVFFPKNFFMFLSTSYIFETKMQQTYPVYGDVLNC